MENWSVWKTANTIALGIILGSIYIAVLTFLLIMLVAIPLGIGDGLSGL